jgi:hypothetical protein
VPRPALALALWSLFVWGVRIRNAAGEVGPTVVAVTFVALAVAVLVTRGDRGPVLALAGWTVIVWAVRLVDIAFLSDHEAAFVLVHAVLAVVSVALAAWAVTGRRPAAAGAHS